MNITFSNFKLGEKITVSFGRHSLVFTMPAGSIYNNTFFICTTFSEEQMKEMFGDVRKALSDCWYLPYRLHSINITNDSIKVVGYSAFMRYEILTPIKWRRTA